MFSLKRIVWDDGQPPKDQDYEVMLDGRAVGRIYRRNSAKETWCWAIYGWGCRVCTTLDEAKERFKTQWARLE